jgi:hypothetical protein
MKAGLLTQGEVQRLKVSETKVLWRISGPRREEVTAGERK